MHPSQDRSPDAANSTRSVLDVLQRLGRLLEEENAMLEANGRIELQPVIDQKNRLLRESMLMQRHYGGLAPTAEVAGALAKVRELLALNAKLLNLQLDAMRDITETLADVVAREDSDGTYSRAAV
jgi:flagellar biosynthesis/type III secretory pathway chaperone